MGQRISQCGRFSPGLESLLTGAIVCSEQALAVSTGSARSASCILCCSYDAEQIRRLANKRRQATMKYSFNIKISDDKREHVDKLIIGAFAAESESNIVLKFLAYLLFIGKRPVLDEDAGWQVMPDLTARDESGELCLWVSCGSLSVKKVDLITTKGRDRMPVFVFRKNQREMEEFYGSIKDKAKHLNYVRCISFDDGFVDELGKALDRTNNIEGYIGGDMITLTVENSLGRHEAFSTVHRLGNPAPH